jgi:hypothetical protein
LPKAINICGFEAISSAVLSFKGIWLMTRFTPLRGANHRMADVMIAPGSNWRLFPFFMPSLLSVATQTF